MHNSLVYESLFDLEKIHEVGPLCSLPSYMAYVNQGISYMAHIWDRCNHIWHIHDVIFHIWVVYDRRIPHTWHIYVSYRTYPPPYMIHIWCNLFRRWVIYGTRITYMKWMTLLHDACMTHIRLICTHIWHIYDVTLPYMSRISKKHTTRDTYMTHIGRICTHIWFIYDAIYPYVSHIWHMRTIYEVAETLIWLMYD